MKKSQKGFSAVETVLVIVVVGIIGFVGWFVWQSRNNTVKTLKDTSQGQSAAVKTTKKATPAAKDPTADWVAYSSTAGKYSLKHPKNWVEASHLDQCNDGLFLVGGNASSVGVCGSESFGQMNVDSQMGDISAGLNLASDGYVSVTKTSTTAAGVSGTKYSGTASGQQSGDAPGGFADGTKVVRYIFVTNDRTYSATYAQQSGYPDVLSDFDLMVTKTLKFSS